MDVREDFEHQPTQQSEGAICVLRRSYIHPYGHHDKMQLVKVSEAVGYKKSCPSACLGDKTQSMMIPYQNLNLSSPVSSFVYGVDWIMIEWLSGEMQTYRHNEIGKRRVDQMIKFAKLGKGLYSYIEKNGGDFRLKKKHE